jgi:hypothetical protein
MVSSFVVEHQVAYNTMNIGLIATISENKKVKIMIELHN